MPRQNPVHVPPNAPGGDVLDVQDPAPERGRKIIPRLVQGEIYQKWYKSRHDRAAA